MSETNELSEVTATIVGVDREGKGIDYIMKIGGEEYNVSRQLFDDNFNYDAYQCAQPRYNFDALLYFFENNTWHSRCCRLKAACTVGLGYILQLIDGMKPDETEKKKLKEFFDNCNPTETFSEILEKFMIDYEAIGNAYLEIIRNLSGDIVGMYHIPAQTMRMRKDRDGFVQVRDTRYVFFKNFGDKAKYNTQGQKDSEGTITLDTLATEIIHFSQYSPRSDFYGVPEWLTAAAAMLGSEKAEDFNIQFFENNAVPHFAIILKKATAGDEFKNTVTNFFRKEIKGKNHRTLVLDVPGEGELELKELVKDIKDAHFRFYRLDNRDEVIAAHGVPPRLVGIIATGTMGGKGDSDGQKEAFLTQIIAPRQNRLNHRINKLLIQTGSGVKNYKFELEKLNDSNSENEAKIHEVYVKLGILTVNQVRDLIRQPRYEFSEADKPFLFTSSGPILLESLEEYMKIALMPKQPNPPGLPGGPGVSTTDDSPKRDVKKIIDEIVDIQKRLRDELLRNSGTSNST